MGFARGRSDGVDDRVCHRPRLPGSGDRVPAGPVVGLDDQEPPCRRPAFPDRLHDVVGDVR